MWCRPIRTPPLSDVHGYTFPGWVTDNFPRVVTSNQWSLLALKLHIEHPTKDLACLKGWFYCFKVIINNYGYPREYQNDPLFVNLEAASIHLCTTEAWRSITQPHTHNPSHTHTLSHTLNHTHSHTPTHPHTLTHTHTHPHTPTLSLTHIHSHTNTHWDNMCQAIFGEKQFNE